MLWQYAAEVGLLYFDSDQEFVACFCVAFLGDGVHESVQRFTSEPRQHLPRENVDHDFGRSVVINRGCGRS